MSCIWFFLCLFLQDIFQQNIGRSGTPFGGSQGLPSPHPKAPLNTSLAFAQHLGKKRGPKLKDGFGGMGIGPPGAKKKSQKGKEIKTEAGELDLLEIHTKHTLKKFQPGCKVKKSKVEFIIHLLRSSFSKNFFV